MKNAVIYARFSSSAQRDESIEDQLRICREYCTAHGLTVVGEYYDKALSGLTDSRPQFQQMIKDGERRLYDTLVLYSLDRFARNKYDSAIYKARLKKAGIKIIYVTTPIGEGAEAVLMETVLEGLANYYSENLARSVRRGMEGNALKARWNSTPPLGYIKDADKRLTPNPLTAPIVRKIFEEYAVGRPIADIIREINATGARTAGGKPFTRNSFSSVLNNRVYIGEYKWADIVIQNAVTPLITEELYNKVQIRMESNNRKSGHFKAKEEYILSGKLWCGHCGGAMVGECGKSHTGTYHYYYSCTNHKRPEKGVERCVKRPERKADLEANILRFTLDALTDDVIEQVAEAAYQMLKREAEQADKLPTLKAQLKEVETKTANIMTAIENGIFTATTKSRLVELENQKAQLLDDIEQSAHPLPVLSKEQLQYWLINLRAGAVDSPEYTRRLVDTFINSVSVTDEPEGKKIALIFNLKTNACRTYMGSDLLTEVHQRATYTNPIMLSADHFMVIRKIFL